ncbi:MAG: LolA family protein [Planctomycetota bacterium]|jgi:outer membrane lipoprotein-sorting protein
MSKITISKALLVLLAMVNITRADECAKDRCSQSQEKVQACPLEQILKQLKRETKELNSYHGRIEHLYRQPKLFDSKTLKKGDLYYEKSDGKSRLKINFKTLKHDDEKEQKYREEYIFDGVWLTHINYQIEQANRYQLAEPNELVDAFDLAAKNFPIIGFAKIEDLNKDFEIKLVEEKESEPSQFIRLHLKVKPDSAYKDDYTSFEFWIDKKLNLPAQIVAVTTEEDISQVKLLKPQVNKNLKKGIFDFKIPKGFAVSQRRE